MWYGMRHFVKEHGHGTSFAGGLLLGGLALHTFTTKSGKHKLAQVTACGLRAKNGLMAGIDQIQAEAQDIAAEAQAMSQPEEVVEPNVTDIEI